MDFFAYIEGKPGFAQATALSWLPVTGGVLVALVKYWDAFQMALVTALSIVAASNVDPIFLAP
ncbi:hypothetical protein D3C77_424740 [compost metagenome]